MYPLARRFLSALTLALVAGMVLSPHAVASDDKYSARQWALKKVRAEKAWADGGRGKGITIGIIDSGVDLKHEDLKGSLVKGYDFVDDDADPSDEHGHGTHVAGIAAARADNGIGIAGVAPEAKIMPVRVLDENGAGTGADVDAGIRWAADHGADVINLSLSDGDVIIESLFGDSLNASLNYAWSKGSVPVVVSGNDGFFRTQLASANAIMVTATGPNDAKADYANSVGFAKWAIAAPGGTPDDGKSSMVFSTIWSANGKTRYAWAYGTSMAAPHVAGAAAILRGLGRTPQQTVDRLLSSARDLGEPGRDNVYGSGLLDVGAAVSGLRPAPTATAAGDVVASSSPRSAAPSDVGKPTPSSSSTNRSPKSAGAETPAGTPDDGSSDATDVPPSIRAIANEEPRGRSPVIPAFAVATLLMASGGAVALTLRGKRGTAD